MLPALLSFAVRRDRGALKGSLLHITLGGVSHSSIDGHAQRFVTQLLPSGLYAQALDAIATHRERGDRLLLMSASVDIYVPLIGRALGFDETLCTQVRWRPDGLLDGRLASANCRGEEKRRCLAAVIARDAPGRVYAYGNSDSDLPHMQLAQQAFLVNGPGRLNGKDLGAAIQRVRWTQTGSI